MFKKTAQLVRDGFPYGDGDDEDGEVLMEENLTAWLVGQWEQSDALEEEELQ